MAIQNSKATTVKPAAAAKTTAAAKPAASTKTTTAAKPAAAAKTTTAKPAATAKAAPAAAKPAANAVAAAVKNVTDNVENAAKNAQNSVKTAAAALKEADGVKVDKNTRNEMFKKICGIIPNQISNKTVVNAFEMMRAEQKLLRKDFSAHLKTNEANFKKHSAAMTKADGYIEDQNAWTDVAYGDSTMQYSGCEIFATFNAIYNILGKHTKSLAELISAYEKDGMVFSGKFGTSPKAISDLLEKEGFTTKLTTEASEFDGIGKAFQSLILTMYNDGNDISQEVHTVNISKAANKFTAHNVYCNGKVVGPYDSVSELISHINNGKAKGISLIGIKKA